MSWQDFPMITCPHCNQEFQVDDYYDFSHGDSFDCGKCEKEIYIWATDTVLSGDIRAKPEEIDRGQFRRQTFSPTRGGG